jgi:hypothetical protein
LRGRARAPTRRRGRKLFSRARDAKQKAHHGPLQRLEDRRWAKATNQNIMPVAAPNALNSRDLPTASSPPWTPNRAMPTAPPRTVLASNTHQTRSQPRCRNRKYAGTPVSRESGYENADIIISVRRSSVSTVPIIGAASGATANASATRRSPQRSK